MGSAGWPLANAPVAAVRRKLQFDSRETLHEALGEITHKFTEARKSLRDTEEQIKKLNEQIQYVGQYQSRKCIQRMFFKYKKNGRFLKEHNEDLDLYNAGVQYIKEHFNGKPPSLQALKSQRNQLLQMKEAQYGTYRYFQDYQ